MFFKKLIEMFFSHRLKNKMMSQNVSVAGDTLT